MKFFEAKVIDIVKETSDSYSFKMEIPEGFTWESGQHTMWKFKDHQVEEGDRPIRIFTIASAMEDGFLMFTTRIAEFHTSFKNILLHELKVGDVMLVAEPKGDFTIHGEYNKSLVIAGGIGITPIRSILKHLQSNNMENHEVVVIYSDDRGEFAYNDTFKEMTESMSNLTIHHVSDRDIFMKEVDEYVAANGNQAEYLVAGSPGMNSFFTSKLVGLGVEEDNIKVDNFQGY